MSEINFIRVVCVDEGDPFEYRVLEDTNRNNMDEVFDLIKQKQGKYKGAGIKWILMPSTATI